MQIIENPIISDQIRWPKRFLRRFKAGKITLGVYVLRTAYAPDQLEIIKAEYYKQKFIKNEDKIIVGFAANYDDACEMVISLTNKAMEELGEPDILGYIFR